MTKQNGIDVWPNAAIWMRDELRSKVISLCHLSSTYLLFTLYKVFICLLTYSLVVVGDLLKRESDQQLETTVNNRSSLARKKVLRRRRTSDRGGSKRSSVTDHTHSSKPVTPVKRASVRGMSFI